jgi:hypothetical protein
VVIDFITSRMLRLSYMPYQTGEWGQQQKERSKRRLAYFKAYHRLHGPPQKVFRLGHFGELLAQQKLSGSTLVNRTGHDLIWNGQRIEVKTSQMPSADKNGNCHHSFDIRIQKRENHADFFLALILDEHTRELRHAYLIPAKAVTANITLNIYPGRSKYDRFRLRLQQTSVYARTRL